MDKNDVVRDENYYLAAIKYNEELASFAKDLSERLEHPLIAKWCLGVSKQHQFHAGRHRHALAKLQEVPADEIVSGGFEDGVSTIVPLSSVVVGNSIAAEVAQWAAGVVNPIEEVQV